MGNTYLSHANSAEVLRSVKKGDVLTYRIEEMGIDEVQALALRQGVAVKLCLIGTPGFKKYGPFSCEVVKVSRRSRSTKACHCPTPCQTCACKTAKKR